MNKVIGIFIIALFILVTLASCKTDGLPIETSTFTKTIDLAHTTTQTPTPPPTKVPTVTLTITPTLAGKTSYRYLDPILNELISTIVVTQGPVTILSTEQVTHEYLYKNLIIQVHLANETYVLAYLNLDDPSNNSTKNSDIVIKRTTGSGGSFYSLRPVNNSVYYKSDQKIMDFNSCLEHFPVLSDSENDSVDYINQGDSFIQGNSFCVITNEGRMATIQYKNNSIINNYGHTQDLSVIVNVYSEILK